MIELISNRLLAYLLKSNTISGTEEERAHYKYGIEITISSMLNIILVMMLGLIFSKIKLSSIFLLLFISIRQLTGGYHAKTYFKCNLTMCISFTLCILATIQFKTHLNLPLMIIHLILSSLIILVFCPISNINKPVKTEARFKYKIISLIVTNLFSVMGYMIYIVNMEIGLFIIMSIILINGLVIISKFTERSRNNEQ